MAVSADGLLWGAPVEGQMVLAPGGSGSWDSKSATLGSIVRDAAGLHMYYAGGTYYLLGGDGIGYATSGDGLTWVKNATPLLHKSDGVAWRANYIGAPSIVLAGGILRLFLYSYDGLGNYSVGLAMPDLTPPVLVLNAPSPSALWPANGQSKEVIISGSAYDDGSGVSSASLTVADEYGVQNQTIDLTGSLSSADGSFSQVVSLAATRNSGDDDGHVYRITLNATDARSNVATPLSVTVVVPVSRPETDDGSGPGNGTGNGNGYGIGNGHANGHSK